MASTFYMPPPRVVQGKPVYKHRKAKIPKALREQVWRNYIGSAYNAPCLVTWCTNQISVFDFEVGHNIPESKGGTLDIQNLRPICARCNRSMGNKYTIDEWNKLGKPTVDHGMGCGCWPWLRPTTL